MATIIFAGGGTAGHIEPALAVARQWKLTKPTDECIFLGTISGLENSLVPAAGFALALIPKVKISRNPSGSWIRIPFDLISSVNACRKVIKDANLLIGFGGYVSAPAYIAAKIASVPILIHEANVKPGWANRLGSMFTKYLAVAHPVESGRFSKALLAGLPLRLDVVNAFEEAKNDWSKARLAAKVRLGFSEISPLIFILGGSQGSIALNQVMQSSVEYFNEQGYSVLHSVGRSNLLPVSMGQYKAVPYVDAMADAYLAADLIIGRSGAVTCSEFRALGRYALFVPLPIGNGEQFVNAASLVQDGRAKVVDQKFFTSEFLRANLAGLLKDSAQATIAGNGQDLMATQKIAALAEFAMSS